MRGPPGEGGFQHPAKAKFQTTLGLDALAAFILVGINNKLLETNMQTSDFLFFSGDHSALVTFRTSNYCCCCCFKAETYCRSQKGTFKDLSAASVRSKKKFGVSRWHLAVSMLFPYLLVLTRLVYIIPTNVHGLLVLWAKQFVLAARKRRWPMARRQEDGDK